MEWIPKYLDSIDSAAIALYQSWVGHYRWIVMRVAISILAVAAMTVSPTVRALAVAAVVTYVFVEFVARFIARSGRFRPARAQI